MNLFEILKSNQKLCIFIALIGHNSVNILVFHEYVVGAVQRRIHRRNEIHSEV